MKDFEDQLRSVLRRQEPPPGFTGRLAARMGANNKSRPGFRWPMAIAAAVVLTAGLFEYREYHRQVEGRQAKSELMFALQITGNKLNMAQKKIIDLSERRIHE